MPDPIEHGETKKKGQNLTKKKKQGQIQSCWKVKYLTAFHKTLNHLNSNKVTERTFTEPVAFESILGIACSKGCHFRRKCMHVFDTIFKA